MMRTLGALMVLACVTPGWAWVDLGSLEVRAPEQVQRISLDFEGTLGELRDVLHEDHSVFLMLWGGVGDTRVDLDLSDATPDELLAEACEQAGCVYRSLDGRGRTFTVQPGDREADPRPTVEVGDYRIFVERVEVADTASLGFEWGSPQPEKHARNELSVAISAEARDVAAARMVYGLSGGAEVVTSAGEELPRTGSQRWITQAFEGQAIHLDFPPPTRSARSATLTGKLFLFADLATIEVTLDPAAPGQPVAADGTTWTLLEWERAEDGLRAVIGGDGTLLRDPHHRLVLSLVGPGGERVEGGPGNRSWSSSRSPNVTEEWRFDAPEWQPVAILVGGTAGIEPLRPLNFTIEDIPLP